MLNDPATITYLFLVEQGFSFELTPVSITEDRWAAAEEAVDTDATTFIEYNFWEVYDANQELNNHFINLLLQYVFCIPEGVEVAEALVISPTKQGDPSPLWLASIVSEGKIETPSFEGAAAMIREEMEERWLGDEPIHIFVDTALTRHDAFGEAVYKYVYTPNKYLFEELPGA